MKNEDYVYGFDIINNPNCSTILSKTERRVEKP